MSRTTRAAPVELVFEVPLPPLVMSPNRKEASTRLWRSGDVAMYRTMVMMEARTAAMTFGWVCPERARVSLLWGLKRGKGDGFVFPGYRPDDADNAVAAFKPGFDGLTRAGVIRDDSWGHMVLGCVEMTRSDGPWVRVKVERLE